MTTLVGIQAYAGTKGIILASDTQLNAEQGEERSRSLDFNKLIVGEYWAMAFCGNYYTTLLRRFATEARREENKGTIERAVTDRENLSSFTHVLALNQQICQRFGDSEMVSFLLATSKPSLGLYFVDVMGNVLESNPEDSNSEGYLVLGSGSKVASEFLAEELNNKDVTPQNVTLEAAVKLAYDAIMQSRKDPWTGGLALLAAVTERDVDDFVPYIKRETKRLGDTIQAGIIEQLNKKYKPPEPLIKA